MSNETIEVLTPKCPLCDTESIMLLNRREWLRWINGALAQNAFISLDAEGRELLKSGTHAACWDILMKEG